MDVGERMTPHNLFNDAVREEFTLTMQRYRFAVEYAKNAAVLDSGCGVGNGSFLLSAVARSVLGIDDDPEAITFAKTYYPTTNIAFEVHDVLDTLPRRFDLIVSFDVLEHVTSTDRYLDALATELNDTGTLILSTPNKSVLHLVYSEPNRFHLHEMDLGELEKALATRFTIQKIYGQHMTPEGPSITDEYLHARTFIAICKPRNYAPSN